MSDIYEIQKNIERIFKSRKLKVALLGGAFNPITNGHIQAAQFVLDASKEVEEVWLTPCAHHLYNKPMENAKHRLEMCKLAIEVDGRIKIFDYEIENDFAGETYHLVKRLLDDSISQSCSFSIIIGQDNANTFDKWVNYEKLKEMIRFIVVQREGVERDSKVDWYLKQPHIYLKHDSRIMKVSSTEVRGLLLDSCGIEVNNILEKYLDSKVFNYIEKNKLYGGKK